MINFNPRPHTKGDQTKVFCSFRQNISILAPTQRATGGVSCDSGAGRNFNPRPHTKGDVTVCPRSPSLLYFNPRPHTKGDPPGGSYTAGSCISILAPTQRATPVRPDQADPARISILAPTQRATRVHTIIVRCHSFQSSPPHKGRPITDNPIPITIDFNPRPHTKGDASRHGINRCTAISILAPTQRATHSLRCQYPAIVISILAPTQRATSQRCTWTSSNGDFNPRPHTKGDALGGSVR